jgi:hypothetical protein
MGYLSIPSQPRQVRATEAVLDRIYNAAKVGLKGDSLALASGLLPIEFRQLCELDPSAELAARQGKADAELEHATLLAQASRNGDAKASLSILQHIHGWQSKEQNASFGQNGITIVIGDVQPKVIANQTSATYDNE